jgi:hypothetical protein
MECVTPEGPEYHCIDHIPRESLVVHDVRSYPCPSLLTPPRRLVKISVARATTTAAEYIENSNTRSAIVEGIAVSIICRCRRCCRLYVITLSCTKLFPHAHSSSLFILQHPLNLQLLIS